MLTAKDAYIKSVKEKEEKERRAAKNVASYVEDRINDAIHQGATFVTISHTSGNIELTATAVETFLPKLIALGYKVSLGNGYEISWDKQ